MTPATRLGLPGPGLILYHGHALVPQAAPRLEPGRISFSQTNLVDVHQIKKEEKEKTQERLFFHGVRCGPLLGAQPALLVNIA